MQNTKNTIDMKSLMAGLLLAFGAILVLGAADDNATETGPIGRFQIAVGDSWRCALVLDTKTGEAWAYRQRPPENPGDDSFEFDEEHFRW